jgi:hypothetical protein
MPIDAMLMSTAVISMFLGAISIRFGIAVPTDASTLASIYSVQQRSDPVLGVHADGMAGEAFPKRSLARRNILRDCC